MANITTSLPIVIEENNSLQKYTKEREILSGSIKAPQINYLPIDYCMEGDHCRSTYSNKPVTKVDKHFHFNLNNLEWVSYRTIFLIDLINTINFTIDQPYTFSYRIYNVTGTYDPTSFSRNWVLTDNTLYVQGTTITTFYPHEGFFYFTFTPSSSNLNLAWGHNLSWVNAVDLSFDLEIIGLVKGEEPIERAYNAFSVSPLITVSNTDNILGEYQISRDVRRHIKQIERDIKKQEDTFKITWR